MIRGQDEAIAIVGYGGLFPGAPDPARFWSNIERAVDATTEVPPGRWILDTGEAYDPAIPRPDRVYSTRGGFCPDVRPEVRGLALEPSLLNRLDPVFRLAVHAALAAWNAARTESLDRSRVGVIFGHIVLPTEHSSALSRAILARPFDNALGIESERASADPLDAFPAGLPAALVARTLGLGGPAFTLDAACASTLYALKLATDELLSGRADAMLSGGVSRPDPLYTQMGFSQLRALSARGVPAPFDERGDGLVVGEGAGLFVLKRLADALRQGDTIHAVIRGVGLSNDVHGDLLAPSSEGQLRAMRAAYEQAGWSPQDVDLIECHATGTPVGDAVEVQSLKQLWGEPGGWTPGQCVIGSVKSNVGHLLTAAGAAGLVKLLMSLRHQVMPPTANQTSPGAGLEIEGSPFRIARKAEPWLARASGRPRRAALSGFGFGGINAHLLLEEWTGAGLSVPGIDPAVPRSGDPPPATTIAIVGLAVHCAGCEDLKAFQRRALGLDPPGNLRPIRGADPDRHSGHALGPFRLPPDRFRIPPLELSEMLPQQSLMLKVAAEAVEDAAWPSGLALRSGVAVGLGLDQNTNNYQLRWWLKAMAPRWNDSLRLGLSPKDLESWVEQLLESAGPPLSANRTMGSLGGLVASRIARELRIGGPSFSVSCDEGSGIEAVRLAAGWLRRRELDSVIVGAVDLGSDLRSETAREELGMPGTPGDGAVALVLKRLDDARDAGDRIYAVIPAEERVPSTLQAEARALVDRTTHSMGQMGAATGLVAVAAAATRLHLRVIPAEVDSLAGSRHLRPWLRNREEGPRRAAVGLTALGGTHHELVLEEYEPASEPESPLPGPEGPFAVRSVGPGRLAFVYPGLGNVHPGMGRTLGLQFPEVLRRQDARNRRLRDQFVPGVFWDAAEFPRFEDHRTPILGQVAVGSLVTDILAFLGVRPDAAIGYSMGESAALVALGAWEDRDELADRLRRSPLFATELAGPCHAARRAWGLSDGEPADWLAGIVPCPAARVESALAGLERVYVLIRNTPEETVIGGQAGAVRVAARALGVPLLELPLVSTVHCPVGAVVEADYRALHDLPTRTPEGIDFYSGVWGKPYHPDRRLAADAITAQAAGVIDFPALIERAYADGVRIFVEIGPGTSCKRLIDRILGDRPHLAVPAMIPQRDELETLAELAEKLVAAGLAVNLKPLHGGGNAWMGMRQASRPLVAEERTLLIDPDRLPRVAEVHVPRRVPEIRATGETWLNETATNTRQEIPPGLDVSPLARQILQTDTARSAAHEVFLRVSRDLGGLIARNLEYQLDLIGRLCGGDATSSPWAIEAHEKTASDPAAANRNDFLDRERCLEFAVGSIAAVLGPDYSPIDANPTRVRLPDEPLMLVDRIVAVEGEPRSLTPGRVVTEHDIHEGVWYLDAGRIPACIAIESGQADLFLSGYLGIDFVTQGMAVYRLLDATVTFHRGLPGPGEVIRYDIRITRFFRQGETHLFRFEFDGTVGGEPLLTMRDGCAGFFTARELAAGQGIVPRPLDAGPRAGVRPEEWAELAPMSETSLDDRQVEALRRGALGEAFGGPFERLELEAPIPLPGGRMTLIHRVETLDPRGGRYGLGLIRGEADIHPDDWFMVCHFVDDRVMPGTLMYECCLHTLRIFLMRLGWVGSRNRVAFEPLPGVANRLRCRGQVVESTRKVTYEVVIKELGYGPEPYAIADALMYADGKPIVEISDMALRLSGTDRAELERLWRGARQRAAGRDGPTPPRSLYDREQILAFALGKPSDGFGDRYRSFDEGRFIARLPAPPYSFLDRISAVEGTPWEMAAGTSAVAEYDVPPDAWYFESDRQEQVPYAVLLEVALQACGWTSAFMGSALQSDGPLKFRNLGGSATQHAPVDRRSGTLRTRITATKVTRSAGMIIQHYNFAVSGDAGRVFDGQTYFGFFHPDALMEQVGIREGALHELTVDEAGRSRSFPLPDRPPFPDDRWRMLERVDALVLDGGPHGLGVIEGSTGVNPEAWFFRAHFLDDPVWPGSLGLESFLQLLKVVAVERWGGGEQGSFNSPGLNDPHRWVYRGQIVPGNRRVTVQAVVTALDDDRRWIRADGHLSVDGKIIYQMSDFTLRLAACSRSSGGAVTRAKRG
jgi:acyl transferase domain-containing protein/3-hydroxymyristoyl/3-hydroxydecanoyl-(acyl carrier protein) dehydratase